METGFERYIGKTLKVYLKNKFKYKGVVLGVSENGLFLIIDDVEQGEKGIAISEILDYNVIKDLGDSDD